MPNNKKPLIGIIGGKGRLGNWFKNYFENREFKVLISDKDTKLSNKELAKQADIVIVSVPISATAKVIAEVRDHVREDALLTDFTSLKTEPCAELSKTKSGALGMHPLFGPLAADLEKQSIVFCRIRKNKWAEFLEVLFKKDGAKIIKVSPAQHDKQMAFIQSLTHFSNIAFSHFFYDRNFQPKASFMTPVFKLQTLVWGRILAQNSRLYADIEMKNPYFKNILKEYAREIEVFSKDVINGDYQAFQQRFETARSYLSDSIKVAEEKTARILKLVEKQPVRIGKPGHANLKKSKIGFLGPKGTFSWVAAKKKFSGNSLFPFLGIRDIFSAVNDGEIDFGVVPIRNTIAGLVSETVNSFIDFPVCSMGSFTIPVHHCLLSQEKNIAAVKVIRSHHQALSQCHLWLEKNLPEAAKEPASSTVAPILKNADAKGMAFIASPEAAKLFKLNVLAENIENTNNNATRFFLISRKVDRKVLKKLELHTHNTLLFLAVYNRAGVLRDILSVFAAKKINFAALHSIPSHTYAWDYFFFLEMEKSYFSRDIKKCLAQLDKYCPFIRLVGIC